MHALVGLGNPGWEYEGTRHNIGFAVVESLSLFLDIPIRGGGGCYRSGSGTIAGKNVLLAQPSTFMNNSGEAVLEIVERHGVGLRELLVIADDFHLPLGALRLRANGSDGGHNGLYSIIYHLNTGEFPRLRCGIGSQSMPAVKKELASFVLAPFSSDEREPVRELVERARDAAIESVKEGLEAAASRFNRRSRN